MPDETPDPRPRYVSMDGAKQPDGVRWTIADLDRCEHGRHSIDQCFDCPNGRSSGNQYVLSPSSYHEGGRITPGELDRKRVRQLSTGEIQVRIGTLVRGEPIWVTAYDRPRGSVAVTEPTVTEDDGKMPCSECGHRVVPGLHTLAECAKNQQDDAARASQEQED
jgi:hypothetical protein